MSLDKKVEYQFTVLNNELDDAYAAVVSMNGTVTGSSMRTLAYDILSIRQLPDDPEVTGEYFLTCDVTQSSSERSWTPLPAVAKTGQYSDLLGRPTKLSQFENDTHYATTTQLSEGLAEKQNTISVSAKLSADLVDDATAANKFVTEADKTAWNAKQNELIAGNNITINADGRTINAVIPPGLSVTDHTESFNGDDLTLESQLGSGSNTVYTFGYTTDITVPGITPAEQSSAMLRISFYRNGLLMYPEDYSYSVTNTGKLKLEFSAGKNLAAEAADTYTIGVLIGSND